MKSLNPQLSALEMHYLVKELQFLTDSKVDKIYQPEKNMFILQLHKTGRGKSLLKFKVPGYFCLTESKEANEGPGQFCTYLRKKLSNSFLVSLQQTGFERVVELIFRLKEGKLSLVFEFFSPGNIILIQDGKILSALENQEFKDRKIKPGEEYTFPKKDFNFLEINEEGLENLLQRTNKSSAVKALAMDLGLGGVFAEEACFNAGIEKDTEPKKVSRIKELFDAVESLRDKETKACKADEEIFPFELKSKKCQALDISFNQAVDDMTKEEHIMEKKIEAKYRGQIAKIENMARSQESSISQLGKKEQELKERGDKIYENFQKIQQLLEEAKDRNMLEKLKQNKQIKDYSLKEKTITVEL